MHFRKEGPKQTSLLRSFPANTSKLPWLSSTYQHFHVHSCITHVNSSWQQPNCPPSIINDRWMDKAWYMYTTVYLAIDTEGNFDTCYNMDEPSRHHAKWNKRTQKDSHERTYIVWFCFSEVPGEVRFIKTESRMKVGKRNGWGVSVSQGQNFSWRWMLVRGAQECECTWFHPTVHIKMVRMVHFNVI